MQMKRVKILAGTYTAGKSEGIYEFFLEDGKLKDPSLFCKIESSKYICKYEDTILSICDFENGSGLSLIDKKGVILDSLCFEKPSSCYVGVHGGKIYMANYHAGTVSLLKVEDGKLKLVKTVLIKDKAGCHMVLFHEDKVLVPCLFLDKIVVFDEGLNKVNEICFPKGSGPRHGVFTRDHSRLYLVSELSNELFVIDMKDLTIIKQIGLLENGETNTTGTAAVRLSDDEKYLYVSTRGKNVLSVIDLEEIALLQNINCGGDHPRDFILCGEYLLCANRFSDEVVCFKIGKDGRITEESDRIRIPEAVCLIA